MVNSRKKFCQDCGEALYPEGVSGYQSPMQYCINSDCISRFRRPPYTCPECKSIEKMIIDTLKNRQFKLVCICGKDWIYKE